MTPFLHTAARLAVATVTAMWALLASAAPQTPDTISARRAFEQFPLDNLDLLQRSTRLDMLAYYDADSIYRATNAMQGISWLDTVTPDYIKVVITPVSTLQLKVLPDRKGGNIVMSVYTVGDSAAAPDSDVRFWSAQLQELDRSKLLPEPRLKDFFDIPKGCETSQKEIDAMIPFPTVEFLPSPDSDALRARLTIDRFINQDDYNIIRLFLKPEIEYEWKAPGYKLIKKK